MTKYYIACTRNRKKEIIFFLFSVPELLKCKDVFFKNTLFLVHFCLRLAGGYRRQPESFVSNDKVTIRRSSQEPDSVRSS